MQFDHQKFGRNIECIAYSATLVAYSATLISNYSLGQHSPLFIFILSINYANYAIDNIA